MTRASPIPLDLTSLELLADVVFAIDLKGRITTWGRGAEAFFGHCAADVLGQPIQQLYAPEQRRHALDQLIGKRQITASLTVEQPAEWKFVSPKGRPIWLKVRAMALHDGAGRRYGWLLTGTDITQWKQTEPHADRLAVALANTQLLDDGRAKSGASERLQVLHTLGRAISKGSLEMRQLFDTVAEQAGRLLRYDRMSLTLVEGDRFHILGVELGSKSPLGAEMWLPRGGTGFDWALEHNEMLVRPDITQPPHFAQDELAIQAGIRLNVVVPLCARGQALGTWNLSRREPGVLSPTEIETFEMVAEQLAIAVYNVRLHENLAERAARLQQAYAQLEDVNRLKDQMIQNISHELRLPLTIIRGYLELMLDGTLGEVPPGWEEHLKTTNRRTDEIVALVERITTLHGLRLSGVEMERLSLSQLMRARAEAHRRAALEAGLALKLELPEGELEVHGDRDRLAQALDSLLDNAIKFNKQNGHIRLSATNGDDLISVEVTDTGIGIPANRLDRVWDYFYQVDGSTTRRYGGMGVGLALVKEVVEAHGGAVWARSAEGLGSTFGFALRRASP